MPFQPDDRFVRSGNSFIMEEIATRMAMVVLTGAVQLWMLYGFALCFGLAAGFAIPVENSNVATLVQRDDLEAGNSASKHPVGLLVLAEVPAIESGRI